MEKRRYQVGRRVGGVAATLRGRRESGARLTRPLAGHRAEKRTGSRQRRTLGRDRSPSGYKGGEFAISASHDALHSFGRPVLVLRGALAQHRGRPLLAK